MKQIKFANCHAHGTYSMLDGYGTPEQIVDRLKELKQDSCALTDHGNCYGHIPWQKAAKAAGIKPVFGCEFYCVEDSTTRDKLNKSLGVECFPHITILARTQDGYQNFLKLMEESYRRSYYKPRIDENLIYKYQEGLTILTGCPTGWPTRFIDLGMDMEAIAFIKRMNERCERVYIENVFQPGYSPSEKAANKLRKIAKELDMTMVATADAHFPRPSDHEYQDLLLNITFKIPVGQHKPVTLPAYQYYPSGYEMLERGRLMYANSVENYGDTIPNDNELIEYIENSIKVIDECEVEIAKARSVSYPNIPINETADTLLTRWAYEGLQNRFNIGQIDIDKMQEYRDRADRELGVIIGKGFSHYMLAVADICKWIKSQDALVMCRGSAGGSILLWLIDASETDSIAHDLSFERFYDDTRPDPPDVDIDFSTYMKPKVIEYITEKYGSDKVAQLLAISLIRAKVAVVDTANALCIPRSEYEALAMALDSKDDDFDSQLKDFTDPEIIKVIEKHPRLELAGHIVGQARQTTIHAAGVVVSSRPLNELVARLEVPGKAPVCSVDKHSAASIGLLKFDLLSVSAFDVIEFCGKKLNISMRDIYNLKFDDPKVYELAKEGFVCGVFQLDGAALAVGKKIGLDRFEEFYAASALCRPGAMDFVDLYCKNKFNNKIFEDYLSKMDSRAAAIVRPTYGVVLYQEQMMAMARQLAGFEWAKVHALRKRVAAASFNGHALGLEFEEPFITGCANNGISKSEALHWWTAIKQHGIYSFNKSHCVTYGIVSYWMLWLKAYYPDTYYEIYLAQEGKNTNNPLLLKRLIVEWKRTKGNVMQIISKSKPTEYFHSPRPGLIVGGWANLNGLGEAKAISIVKHGAFSTWSELAEYVPKNVYSQLVETGMTKEMMENTGRLLHLAPWFPVKRTSDIIQREINPQRKNFDIQRPGDLKYGEKYSENNIKIAGYISTRFKKPRTGSFKGEQIIYTLEDETGIISVRVSTRKKDLQMKVKEAFDIGDYVVCMGWWTGEGTLFISNFIHVRKWDAPTESLKELAKGIK